MTTAPEIFTVTMAGEFVITVVVDAGGEVLQLGGDRVLSDAEIAELAAYIASEKRASERRIRSYAAERRRKAFKVV